MSSRLLAVPDLSLTRSNVSRTDGKITKRPSWYSRNPTNSSRPLVESNPCSPGRVFNFVVSLRVGCGCYFLMKIIISTDGNNFLRTRDLCNVTLNFFWKFRGQPLKSGLKKIFKLKTTNFEYLTYSPNSGDKKLYPSK